MYKNMLENPSCIILLIGKKNQSQMASVCICIIFQFTLTCEKKEEII
jgi:hypothetical protein